MSSGGFSVFTFSASTTQRKLSIKTRLSSWPSPSSWIEKVIFTLSSWGANGTVVVNHPEPDPTTLTAGRSSQYSGKLQLPSSKPSSSKIPPQVSSLPIGHSAKELGAPNGVNCRGVVQALAGSKKALLTVISLPSPSSETLTGCAPMLAVVTNA